MDVSVCITVKNEEKSISDLIMSLLTQSKKADEIVIVDGGSTDKTKSILKHYQSRHKNVKVSFGKPISRSTGRNIAVTLSKNDVIVITDAGCIPQNDWLEKITNPFKKNQTEVVAGFYKMRTDNNFQKALSVFLGTLPDKYNSDFLPSARSMGFRRNIFEKTSGFPEHINDTAEDSLYAANLIMQGIKIVRVKTAIVEWKLPETLKQAANKFYKYSFGDILSGIWIHPLKGYRSHNIKALLILLRYLIFLALIFLSINNKVISIILVIILLTYAFWAFNKVYVVYRNFRVGLWGIIIQIVSDFSVMGGLINGLLRIR